VLVVRIALSAAAAFFIGAIPWSFIIGKRFYGVDLRKEGSGNLGATNTYRVLGIRAGLAAATLDIAKGFAAVGIAWLLVPPSVGTTAHQWTLVAATMAAVLGHSYSPYVGFAGGKGIATAAGALLLVTPQALPILLLTWIVVLTTTRYVSLGSIIIAAEYPLLVIWLYPDEIPFIIFSVAASALVIWRHRSNIARLASGKESKLQFKRGGTFRRRGGA
jgi:glycerol-3-phosphate acyltransferase PlsY